MDEHGCRLRLSRACSLRLSAEIRLGILRTRWTGTVKLLTDTLNVCAHHVALEVGPDSHALWGWVDRAFANLTVPERLVRRTTSYPSRHTEEAVPICCAESFGGAVPDDRSSPHDLLEPFEAQEWRHPWHRLHLGADEVALHDLFEH